MLSFFQQDDFNNLAWLFSFLSWFNALDSVLTEERHELEDEDALAEDDGEKSRDNPATSGSRGTAYGGGNELFQSQFQLHTAHQKLNQIVLLKVGKSDVT